ncbi:MAG: DUF58 domain-containing protein [Deltaproteobacteria bacterium]|jgi:uncharacterized protein (DUF58 family)|nr:DUF58 domain-containing protein [Deltaproteobacteria bacterium]
MADTPTAPPIRGTTRPTPRAALCFALAVPLALAVVAAWPELWQAALCPPLVLLSLMAADAILGSVDARMDLDLRAPTRLYAGQTGALEVRLTLDGLSREFPLQALLEHTGVAAPSVPASGRVKDGGLDFSLAIHPRRRGLVRLEALWLRWRGPLGFMEMRRRRGLDKTVEVVPDVRGIHEAALQFFAKDAVHGVKAQRPRGEGTEFEALREYAQGMDNRLLDWKRSARHRKLLAKEFRQERNHQIVFGFDTGHLMLEPVEGQPKLDHAIRAGLLLSWVSLRSGDFVGGCGFDARFHHFLEPGRGMPYFLRMQRFTAGLEYRTTETNFTVGLMELYARLRRRALVVLFTEFADSIAADLLLESLGFMARRHVVIFVSLRDPMLARLQAAPPDDFFRAAEAVIADGFLRERSIVLERVARLGVHCLDVPARELSAGLLNRYLLIKQRGLL